MQESWIFFIVAVVLAGLANFCAYFAMLRLGRKGVKVRFLATPKDTIRMFKEYGALAKQNTWSLWPIYGFWLFSVPAIVAVICAIFYLNLSREPRVGISEHFPSIGAALAWGAVSSLCIAGVFSYRFLRGTASHSTVVRDRKQWIADDYVRNDFWIAMLGWIGFVVASAALVAKHGK